MHKILRGLWVSLSLRSNPSIWNIDQQKKHHLAGPSLCWIKLLSTTLFFSLKKKKKSQILNCWIQSKLFSLKLLKALSKVAPNLYCLLSYHSQMKCLASAGSLSVHLWALVPSGFPTWVTVLYLPMKIQFIFEGLAPNYIPQVTPALIHVSMP